MDNKSIKYELLFSARGLEDTEKEIKKLGNFIDNVGKSLNYVSSVSTKAKLPFSQELDKYSVRLKELAKQGAMAIEREDPANLARVLNEVKKIETALVSMKQVAKNTTAGMREDVKELTSEYKKLGVAESNALKIVKEFQNQPQQFTKDLGGVERVSKSIKLLETELNLLKKVIRAKKQLSESQLIKPDIKEALTDAYDELTNKIIKAKTGLVKRQEFKVGMAQPDLVLTEKTLGRLSQYEQEIRALGHTYKITEKDLKDFQNTVSKNANLTLMSGEEAHLAKIDNALRNIKAKYSGMQKEMEKALTKADMLNDEIDHLLSKQPKVAKTSPYNKLIQQYREAAQKSIAQTDPHSVIGGVRALESIKKVLPQMDFLITKVENLKKVLKEAGVDTRAVEAKLEELFKSSVSRGSTKDLTEFVGLLNRTASAIDKIDFSHIKEDLKNIGLESKVLKDLEDRFDKVSKAAIYKGDTRELRKFLSELEELSGKYKQLSDIIHKVKGEEAKVQLSSSSLKILNDEIKAFKELDSAIKKANATEELLVSRLERFKKELNVKRSFAPSEAITSGEEIVKKYEQAYARIQDISKRISKLKASPQVDVDKLKTLERELDATRMSLGKISVEASKVNTELSKFSAGKWFNMAAKRAMTYASLYTGMYEAVSLVRNAIRTMFEADNQIKTFQAILDVTADKAKYLEERLIGLGKAYGGALDEINKAATDLGRAGISFEDILPATEVVMKMAKLTGDSIGTSANAIISFSQVYKDSGIEKLGDQLAYVANQSRLSTQDINTFANYALATNKAAGVTVESIEAMATAFSNSGVNASTIGTQLRRLPILLKSTSSKVKDFFTSIGLDQELLANQFAKGGDEADAALEKLTNRLASLSNEDFSKVTRGMNILSQQFLSLLRENAGETLRHLRTLRAGVDGELNKALIISDSHQSAWEKFIVSAQEMAIKFGETLGPGIDSMLEKAKSAMEYLTENAETITRVLTDMGKALLVVGGTFGSIKALGTAFGFVTKKAKLLKATVTDVLSGKMWRDQLELVKQYERELAKTQRKTQVFLTTPAGSYQRQATKTPVSSLKFSKEPPKQSTMTPFIYQAPSLTQKAVTTNENLSKTSKALKGVASKFNAVKTAAKVAYGVMAATSGVVLALGGIAFAGYEIYQMYKSNTKAAKEFNEAMSPSQINQRALKDIAAKIGKVREQMRVKTEKLNDSFISPEEKQRLTKDLAELALEYDKLTQKQKDLQKAGSKLTLQDSITAAQNRIEVLKAEMELVRNDQSMDATKKRIKLAQLENAILNENSQIKARQLRTELEAQEAIKKKTEESIRALRTNKTFMENIAKQMEAQGIKLPEEPTVKENFIVNNSKAFETLNKTLDTANKKIAELKKALSGQEGSLKLTEIVKQDDLKNLYQMAKALKAISKGSDETFGATISTLSVLDEIINKLVNGDLPAIKTKFSEAMSGMVSSNDQALRTIQQIKDAFNTATDGLNLDMASNTDKAIQKLVTLDSYLRQLKTTGSENLGLSPEEMKNIDIIARSVEELINKLQQVNAVKVTVKVGTEDIQQAMDYVTQLEGKIKATKNNLANATGEDKVRIEATLQNLISQYNTARETIKQVLDKALKDSTNQVGVEATNALAKVDTSTGKTKAQLKDMGNAAKDAKDLIVQIREGKIGPEEAAKAADLLATKLDKSGKSSSKLKSSLKNLSNTLNDVSKKLRALNGMSATVKVNYVGGSMPPAVTAKTSLPAEVPKHHTGGLVGNATETADPFNLKPDEVLAVLQEGEYVLSKQQKKSVEGMLQSIAEYTSISTQAYSSVLNSLSKNPTDAQLGQRLVKNYATQQKTKTVQTSVGAVTLKTSLTEDEQRAIQKAMQDLKVTVAEMNNQVTLRYEIEQKLIKKQEELNATLDDNTDRAKLLREYRAALFKEAEKKELELSKNTHRERDSIYNSSPLSQFSGGGSNIAVNIQNIENSYVDSIDKIQKYYENLEQLRQMHEQRISMMREAGVQESIITAEEAEKRKLEIAQESFDKATRIQRMRYELEVARAGAYISELSGILDQVMSAGYLQSTGYFKFYQALKVGEAIISTYAAANKVMADPTVTGPAMWAQMALVIAKGIANVAVIKAQTAPTAQKYHTGGYVGTADSVNTRLGGLKDDEIPAILQKGEYVLSADEVKAIKAANSDGAQTPNSNSERPKVEVMVVNQFDNSYLEEWAQSQEGREVILNIVHSKN